MGVTFTTSRYPERIEWPSRSHGISAKYPFPFYQYILQMDLIFAQPQVILPFPTLKNSSTIIPFIH